MDARETLDTLMVQHGSRLLRLCAMNLRDASLAQDAVQDTFLKAFQQFHRFRGDADALTWLTAIAINVCRNLRRTAWFRRNDRCITPEDLPLTAPDEDRTLLLTVQQLPEKYRQVIILRYYQGMSLDEAGQVLGISRSSAHHRLQKALKLLRLDFDEGRDEHD